MPIDGLVLPAHLDERTTLARRGTDGDLVVCWLHHADRVHENPLLEVAAAAARATGCPLVVHSGFAGRHPHANDRQTLFMLEGRRDTQRRLRELGIAMSVTPPTPAGCKSGLRRLAARARVLVAEDHPLRPYPAWTEAIARRVPGSVLLVDAACVLPGRLVEGIHDRAFRFRQACEDGWRDRIDLPWPEPDLDAPSATRSHLPEDTLDLADLDDVALRDLVGSWPIDHAVGPAPDLRGGESAAIERWTTFRDEGLRAYAAERNDAALDGTSRLSPWLHHGMISPMRIAREASRIRGEGASKFLDELLVWRELSFHFCRTHRDHESIAALPRWAHETLTDHARDPRERRSWESLSRSRTGDRLWDLAQTALRTRGWLHNNLRMTWGKAIADWSGDPAEALARLHDLNDRYAIDGRDPNSIGGLLWCLGLFDRPFPENRPVTGTIRARSTSVHAKRLDLPAYRELVDGGIERASVLVVGAGVAGSIAARTLADHGHRVTLLDKGRGPGGRLSTRRRDDVHFDHGCQVLRLRGELRHELTRSWIDDGVVAPWSPRVRTADGRVATPSDPWFVGMPGMNGLVRHLQADLRVRFSAEVAALTRDDDGWTVRDADGAAIETADRLVLAIPSTQARRLLLDVDADLATSLDAVEVDPVWTWMVSGVTHDPGFDVAAEPTADVRWVAREASRPGRDDHGAWTLHASADWTRRHLERERDEVEPDLRALAESVLGTSLPEGVAHRWRFGLTRTPLGRDHLTNADRTLTICGDWCLGGRVEHAIESGIAAAGEILRDPKAITVNPTKNTLFA